MSAGSMGNHGRPPPPQPPPPPMPPPNSQVQGQPQGRPAQPSDTSQTAMQHPAQGRPLARLNAGGGGGGGGGGEAAPPRGAAVKRGTRGRRLGSSMKRPTSSSSTSSTLSFSWPTTAAASHAASSRSSSPPPSSCSRRASLATTNNVNGGGGGGVGAPQARRLYLAVDCGGTKAAAAVCDQHGQLLARGFGGPSNYTDVGLHAFLASVEAAVTSALRLCGVATPSSHAARGSTNDSATETTTTTTTTTAPPGSASLSPYADANADDTSGTPTAERSDGGLAAALPASSASASPAAVSTASAAIVYKGTLEAAWFGIAGVDSCSDVATLSPHLAAMLALPHPSSRLIVANDTSLLAAPVTDVRFASIRSGVVVIAGTGSIVMSFRQRDHDGMLRTVGRVGGFGWLLGDEGSGYAVGRAAVRSVLDQADRERLDTEVWSDEDDDEDGDGYEEEEAEDEGEGEGEEQVEDEADGAGGHEAAEAGADTMHRHQQHEGEAASRRGSAADGGAEEDWTSSTGAQRVTTSRGGATTATRDVEHLLRDRILLHWGLRSTDDLLNAVYSNVQPHSNLNAHRGSVDLSVRSLSPPPPPPLPPPPSSGLADAGATHADEVTAATPTSLLGPPPAPLVPAPPAIAASASPSASHAVQLHDVEASTSSSSSSSPRPTIRPPPSPLPDADAAMVSSTSTLRASPRHPSRPRVANLGGPGEDEDRVLRPGSSPSASADEPMGADAGLAERFRAFRLEPTAAGSSDAAAAGDGRYGTGLSGRSRGADVANDGTYEAEGISPDEVATAPRGGHGGGGGGGGEQTPTSTGRRMQLPPEGEEVYQHQQPHHHHHHDLLRRQPLQRHDDRQQPQQQHKPPGIGVQEAAGGSGVGAEALPPPPPPPPPPPGDARVPSPSNGLLPPIAPVPALDASKASPVPELDGEVPLAATLPLSLSNAAVASTTTTTTTTTSDGQGEATAVTTGRANAPLPRPPLTATGRGATEVRTEAAASASAAATAAQQAMGERKHRLASLTPLVFHLAFVHREPSCVAILQRQAEAIAEQIASLCRVPPSAAVVGAAAAAEAAAAGTAARGEAGGGGGDGGGGGGGGSDELASSAKPDHHRLVASAPSRRPSSSSCLSHASTSSSSAASSHRATSERAAAPARAARNRVEPHASVLCVGGSLMGVRAYRDMVVEALRGRHDVEFARVQHVDDPARAGAAALAGLRESRLAGGTG